MPSQPRKITAAEWEGNKKAILGLRRSGASLKGEDGIVARMEEDHGFRASPAQYETQFNKWRERKNLNANEWRLIFQITDQYDKDGIIYAVYLNEQLVRPSILKRKRREYCNRQEHAKLGPRLADFLPECIEIRTSGSDRDVSGMVDGDADKDVSTSATCNRATTTNEPTTVATISYVDEIGDFRMSDSYFVSQRLGSIQLSQEDSTTKGALSAPTGGFHEFGSSFLESNSCLPSPGLSWVIDPSHMTNEQNQLTDDPPRFTREASLSFAQLHDEVNHPMLNIFSPVRDNSEPGNMALIRPDTPLRAVSNLGLIDRWTSGRPFLGFEELLGSQGSLSLDPQAGLPPLQLAVNRQSHSIALEPAEASGSSPARQIFTHVQSPLFQGGSSTSGNALLRMEMLEFSLSSLLLPDAVCPTYISNSRTAAQYEVFGFSIYRLLIVSIENNFAGLDGVPIGTVLKLLGQDTQMRSRLLKYLRAIPQNLSKTLAENLVRAAIENCDAPTVSELIRTGLLTPDEIQCTHAGSRYTAVERSAMLHSIEVTRVLLDAGADINKTYENRSNDERGVLELAVRKRGIVVPVDLQLINLLLDWGAKVRVSLVKAAIESKDTILIRALMSKFFPHQHSAASQSWPLSDEFGKWGFMTDAVEILDGQLATTIVMQTVHACFQKERCDCQESMPREFKRLITLAAMKGYSELVEFLLHYTTDRDSPLAGAVRSGWKVIVELLLGKGADAGAPVRIDSSFSFITTSLAEAIRTGNNELVRDFESRGALSQIKEKSRFGATIYAASEVGNMTYVQRLLQMAPDMDGKILNPALSASIKNGHEQIALTLLEAAADVNEKESNSSLGPPLLEALRQRSKILFYMILECEVNISADGNLDGPDATYLEAAAQWGDLSVIKDLVSMGAEINPPLRGNWPGETAVTVAVRTGNKPLVDFLVREYGANLDLSSGWSDTPLQAAISNKDIHMFQYLLDLGADPTHPRVIRRAVSNGRKALAALLSAFRTRYPAGKKGFGANPLQIALMREDIELVDMLLEAKST